MLREVRVMVMKVKVEKNLLPNSDEFFYFLVFDNTQVNHIKLNALEENVLKHLLRSKGYQLVNRYDNCEEELLIDRTKTFNQNLKELITNGYLSEEDKQRAKELLSKYKEEITKFRETTKCNFKKVKYAYVEKCIKGWRNNYYTITPTAVAETFLFNEYNKKHIYKCVYCGNVTDIAVNVGKRLVCVKCLLKYYKLKKHKKQMIKKLNKLFNLNLSIREELNKIAKFYHLRVIETKEYKRAKRKALYILNQMYAKGYFSKVTIEKGKKQFYF